MAILWAGGEDIDFPVIGNATIVTTAGHFRSGWSRCTIQIASTTSSSAKSAPFAGGAVTSAWLSFQFYMVNGSTGVNYNLVAFGLSGTNKMLGLGSNLAQFQIVKFDGTTRTVLATEGGSSVAVNTLQRFDIQVTNYGASATVNVYLNGVSMLTYTGDVTVSGMTNFDSVFIMNNPAATGTGFSASELFVMDSDTRAVQGLQTEALVATGTTNNWSNNTVGNINGISFSDANPANVNTTAKDQEYTVTTPTPVTYSCVGVVISARLARPAAATPTQVKLGYGSAGTGFFGTGAAKTPGVGFSTFQQIDGVNPITGLAWTSADLAALQLDIASA